MRKLIGIIVALFLVTALGCRNDYRDYEFKKPTYGTVKIDSAKFESVIIMESDESLLIASKEGLKEVRMINEGETVGLIILLCFIAFLIGVITGSLAKNP